MRLHIYDAHPAQSGPCEWDHTIEVVDTEDAQNALEIECNNLRAADGYAPGDTIWGDVWDDDADESVELISYTLTEDDVD